MHQPTSILSPESLRPLSRPTLCTPEALQTFRLQIRHHGLSDAATVHHAGLSPATLARWRRHDPALAAQLAAARAAYHPTHAAAYALPPSRTWREAAHRLQRTFVADYGRTRRRLA